MNLNIFNAFNCMRILVTGCAGFIGSKTVHELSKDKTNYIVGIDNMNNYYDVSLKEERLKVFCSSDNVLFRKIDITDCEKVMKLFEEFHFDIVVNLAAQAGVRYSITNPYEYIGSNIVGFMNIIEACRKYPVKHLIYASSSSVYGMNDLTPNNENNNTDNPVSLYAATKKTNELIAHTYSKLYNIPSTGLRFFTVYGSYGRPDMSLMLFANEIVNNGTIKIFNNGDMFRDFTYIDDIVNAILKVVYNEPKRNQDNLYYQIYNVCYSKSICINEVIYELEKEFGKEVKKEYLPMQDGDVYCTYGNNTKFEKDYNFKPIVDIKKGIKKFVEWYKEYYKIN